MNSNIHTDEGDEEVSLFGFMSMMFVYVIECQVGSLDFVNPMDILVHVCGIYE